VLTGATSDEDLRVLLADSEEHLNVISASLKSRMQETVNGKSPKDAKECEDLAREAIKMIHRWRRFTNMTTEAYALLLEQLAEEDKLDQNLGPILREKEAEVQQKWKRSAFLQDQIAKLEQAR